MDGIVLTYSYHSITTGYNCSHLHFYNSSLLLRNRLLPRDATQ